MVIDIPGGRGPFFVLRVTDVIDGVRREIRTWFFERPLSRVAHPLDQAERTRWPAGSGMREA